MTEAILKDLEKNLRRKIAMTIADFGELCEAADISPEDFLHSTLTELVTLLVHFATKFAKDHPPESFGKMMEKAYRIALDDNNKKKEAQAS